MRLDMLDMLCVHVLPIFLASIIVLLDPMVHKVGPPSLDLRVKELGEIPLVYSCALKVEIEEALRCWLTDPLFPLVWILR
jgi:hypothetical protein